MIRSWKANGCMNRREFLRSCGQVMVVTASYEAVSVILGETLARANPADVHIPDEPLEAALSTSEPVRIMAEQSSGMANKSRLEPQGVLDSVRGYVKEKFKDKFDVRTPSAICGVRG